MAVIDFKDVDFSYGRHKILQQVSFSVKEKETLVILGGSGSGKSTILRLLLGLIDVGSGNIALDGEDVTEASVERMVEIRKKMGMVFQEGALFDSLTVGENVGYFLLEHGQRARRHDQDVERKVRAMLKLVGLESTLDMMPSELSGGMRRRVAVARALIYEPRIMLYDEPTTGLDPATCLNLCELINRVKQEKGVSAIMVTHNLEDAWRVGNRFLLLREGRVLWQGTAAALKKLPGSFLDKFFKGEELSGRKAA
jgi:phospholipid/cholesterol/gamma-HCH transport system ATP-binding protein